MSLKDTWVEDLWHGIAGIPVTKTKYPLSKINYMIGMVPYDLWGPLLPWCGRRFNMKRWRQTWERLSNHHVNGTRAFWTCTEDSWSFKNVLMPYKRISDSEVDVLKFGDDLPLILERYEECWKREIATVISVAYISRWPWSIWKGNRNINGTIDSSNSIDFLKDRKTINIYKDSLAMVIDLFKDNSRVILETGNELPSANIDIWAGWNDEILDFMIKEGMPNDRIALNWCNTSKIIPILDKYDPWCFVHGVNCLEWFKRFHKPGCEMQHFFKTYSRICADADGWQPWDAPLYIGQGIKGLGWFAGFQRPASGDIGPSLKLDKERGGSGWMIMSGAHVVDEANGRKPDALRARDVSIKNGLSKEECQKYEEIYIQQCAHERSANPNFPDYDPVVPHDRNKKPELVMIKKVVEELFG